MSKEETLKEAANEFSSDNYYATQSECFTAGAKWQEEQHMYSLEEIYDSRDGYLKAKKEYQEKMKEEILKYNIWFHNHCMYYDGWNIRVPLGDKYPETYTEEEIYDIYLKEQL